MIDPMSKGSDPKFEKQLTSRTRAIKKSSKRVELEPS